jgi:hypothetical protein
VTTKIRLYDLTQIAYCPYGDLDEDTQRRLFEWPHGVERLNLCTGKWEDHIGWCYAHDKYRPKSAPKQEEPTMTATKATGPVVIETITRKRIVPGEYADVVRVDRDMSVYTSPLRTSAELNAAIAILTEVRDVMLENDQ